MNKWRCVICGRFTHESLICPRCAFDYEIWDDMGYLREPFWSIKHDEQLVKDGILTLEEVYEKYRQKEVHGDE